MVTEDSDPNSSPVYDIHFPNYERRIVVVITLVFISPFGRSINHSSLLGW